MILEVGAGKHAWHRRRFVRNIIYTDVEKTYFNRKYLHVICDGQYLPFRNGSFDEVYSRLVIEFAENPYLFLRECIRVAQRQVTVITWHRLSRLVKPKGVKNKFSPKWFKIALQKFDNEVNVEYGFFRISTHIPIPFLTTSTFIVVKVWKNG